MRFEYNVTGNDRKALVTAMGEILQAKPKYMGMPSMNYEVDYFTVDKNGTVEFDDRADSEEIEQLLEGLADKGFVAAPAEMGEAWLDARAKELSEEAKQELQDEELVLTVAIPYDKVAAGNLTRLLEVKGDLIKKALGLTELPIELLDDRIAFPWFQTMPTPDEVKAYTHFIAALCEMSKNQKRITATAKEVENEKYAFRCFLLRLGFIGNEYKEERKILLRNLSGSSAFKDVRKEKTYKVELDDDNFKIFTAINEQEAERIGQEIAEEHESGYCLVEEVSE